MKSAFPFIPVALAMSLASTGCRGAMQTAPSQTSAVTPAEERATNASGYAQGQPVVPARRPNIGTIQASAMPRAVVYRTSQPSDSLVPVNLDAAGGIASYPAPGDLTSPPVKLRDGWLLDRRGISPSSAFTSYTYDEYKALPTAPSPGELLKSIIPDIRVTELVRLPVYASGVTPEEADSIIAAGFPECTIIL